jgi:hypothetical protein
MAMATLDNFMLFKKIKLQTEYAEEAVRLPQ